MGERYPAWLLHAARLEYYEKKWMEKQVEKYTKDLERHLLYPLIPGIHRFCFSVPFE